MTIEVKFEKCSVHWPPSNRARRRSEALMRKWCAHFGQTWRLLSRSLL